MALRPLSYGAAARRLISTRSATVARRLLSTRSATVATWERLQTEATNALAKRDEYAFGMKRLVETRVLAHSTFQDALATTLGRKLGSMQSSMDFGAMAEAAMEADPDIVDAAAADLDRWYEMDPAADGFLRIFLFFKGFHCVQGARIAHHYWTREGGGGKMLASALQSEMADTFGVDIHPNAKWGRGITMDHGGGCVIGETTVIGDNVYLMHDVTLGSTGTSAAWDRHPKIGTGAFLAAKSTVLGNIRVGAGAIVGAHALVVKPVPAGYTALGAPARNVPPNYAKKRMAPSGVEMPKLIELGEGI